MKKKLLKKIRKNLNASKQKGMSFLEIMIVIVIMAGIAAIAGPALFSKVDDANIKNTKIQMKSLEAALELYHLDNFNYPTTEQGLEALIRKPTVGKVPKNWKGPYLKSKKLPTDAWKNNFIYRLDSSDYQVISYGADGEEGGSGKDSDIINGESATS